MLVYASRYLSYNVLIERQIKDPVIIISCLAIIVNSMLFALEAGMDAHIRYALPSYMIILTGLASLFFGLILQKR